MKVCTTIALQLLEASVPQLCEYLSNSVTAAPTLQVFLHMAEKKPALLADHVGAMKQSAQRHPHTVCLAAQVIGAIGKLSKVKHFCTYTLLRFNFAGFLCHDTF